MFSMLPKGIAKTCSICGKSTVKPEREVCKHCGSPEWNYRGAADAPALPVTYSPPRGYECEEGALYPGSPPANAVMSPASPSATPEAMPVFEMAEGWAPRLSSSWVPRQPSSCSPSPAMARSAPAVLAAQSPEMEGAGRSPSVLLLEVCRDLKFGKVGPDDVERLLAEGADPNARDDIAGCTPLFYSSMAQNYTLNPQRTAPDTASPCFVAVSEALIARGAAVNAVCWMGRTPLHNAVAVGHIPTAQLLLSHGADMEAADQALQRPLHVAAKFEYGADCLQLLLANGADLFAKDAKGKTALQIAEKHQVMETTRILHQYEGACGRGSLGSGTTSYLRGCSRDVRY